MVIGVDDDRERMLLDGAPFSLDTRWEIEEAIQQQAVLDSLEHTLKYPSFGRMMMAG